MKIIIVFIFFLSVHFGYSQQNESELFIYDTETTLHQPDNLKASVNEAVIFNINGEELQKIILEKKELISLKIQLDISKKVDINLKRFDVLTTSGKIVEGTGAGDRVIDMKNKVITYCGEIKGWKGSIVTLTCSQNAVYGLVMTQSDNYILGKLNLENLNNKYIIYRESNLKSEKHFECGTDAFNIPEQVRNFQSSLSGSFNPLTTTFLQANIAVESDYETFQRFGSVQNASIYLLALMSNVSAIYIRDINVKLNVSYLRVWSVQNDPYSSGATSYQLLNEFRSYWNANMQNVPRTLAHYITTRGGGLGGVAWLNVLCASVSSGMGYAFSNINGSFNALPTYSWDVDVVAHETGHNFGSPHTHNCGWPNGPIDTCYAPEGGCYYGPTKPRIGTIMSYCHLSLGKVLEFGVLPSELMRIYAEVAECMDTIQSMFLALPNGNQVYYSGTNTIVIWGTPTTGTINIEYSINNGANWITIQNNVPASLRTANWTIPYIPTTTIAKARIYDTGNPNINDESDTLFQIRPRINSFLQVYPPQLSRFNVNPGDTTNLTFTWQKAGTLPEFRYKWMISNPNLTLSYSQISNNSGADTALSISLGKLDSLAGAWGTNLGDSIRCKWSVKAYSLLDSLPTYGYFLVTFIRAPVGITQISTELPKHFYVEQNYPNPFNPVTKIRFGLPASSNVKIRLFDILGREVEKLLNDDMNIYQPGVYEVDFDGSKLSSGIYFYTFEASGYRKTLRMLLVK